MKYKVHLLMIICSMRAAMSAPPVLNESPAAPDEWGYHPRPEQVISVNPPGFVWRPQPGVTWELVCASDTAFTQNLYRITGLMWNVHTPPETWPPGTYYWRYRGHGPQEVASAWSQVRCFTIPTDAVPMPMPTRADLLNRVPSSHPRLFTRPEKVAALRSLAQGRLKASYQSLVSTSERSLRNPASTAEPLRYPEGMERKSEAWRKLWWGNRERTQGALGSAATLGFTWLIGGDERFGQEARRILMDCARWDPQGSTGYRYNDEAGMPYAYYFSRTYTFIYPLLTEEEKTLCRYVMKVRGDEMYRHLCPQHLWRPYSSHSNRAWHFLGEVALAFHGEIEDTEDWLWFALNVFYHVYPVWSDDDGGWHEGMSYWNSYQARFTWWADIMREVLDIDAYDKPYYSHIGDYPLFMAPPGKVGTGFGDLNATKRADHCRELMTVLAAQGQNPRWQWYVEALGGPKPASGYVGFIRGAMPAVTPEVPPDHPASHLFAGTGQAALNTQIRDARDSVQVVFKSSPFGTQSHGYEANNSFLLWAYGQRLLIRSGYRDIYGSAHHRDWMWSTRSVNNITVNGLGQTRHSAAARGAITDFYTSPDLDVVVGEAGLAYEPPLERFTRAILFVKPDLMIVYDRLCSPKVSTFQYHLHAINKMEIRRNNRILVRNGEALCQIIFKAPEALHVTQTDQYDPNPRPRIRLREWHVTGSTIDPARDVSFVTLYRIHRGHVPPTLHSKIEELAGGYILQASVADGTVTTLLPRHPEDTLQSGDLRTTGKIVIRLERTGRPAQTLTVDGIQRE
jgi:hypothetical protein